MALSSRIVRLPVTLLAPAMDPPPPPLSLFVFAFFLLLGVEVNVSPCISCSICVIQAESFCNSLRIYSFVLADSALGARDMATELVPGSSAAVE